MPECGPSPLRNCYRSFWVMEQILEFHWKWMLTMTAGEKALKNIVGRHADFAAIVANIDAETGEVPAPEGYEPGPGWRCDCPICRNDRGESTS
jgi:hypothetical protein